MPIYEYACEKCGKQLDLMQKVGAPPPETCEGCGAAGTMARQVSRTSFVLKGGGWYSDLYGSTKKDAGGSTSPAATADKKADGKTSTPTAKPADAKGGENKGGGTGGGGAAPASGSGTPPAGGSSARAASAAA